MTALRLIALDLSLAATGLAHTHNHRGDQALGVRTIHTARTRHGATDIDHARVNDILIDIAAAAKCRPHLAVIEWLPGFPGRLEVTMRLAELHGVVRHWLWSQKIPYVDVRPTHLQMWATGSGRATKTAVRAAITAEYGHLVHVGTDDEADALSMLSLALAAYGEPLTRVTARQRTRALAAVQWPDVATESGPVVPVLGSDGRSDR